MDHIGAGRKTWEVFWPLLQPLLLLGRITLTVFIVGKITISGTVGEMALVGGVMNMTLVVCSLLLRLQFPGNLIILSASIGDLITRSGIAGGMATGTRS